MTSANPNSALIWFPAIEAAGLPVPKTIFVPYSHYDCLALFDNEKSPEFERVIVACKEAAESIGWPVFIRSDLTSAKHSGPRAYKAESLERIAQVLFKTLEDNELKFWMEPRGPKAFMVREFLMLDHSFTAFRGLPISREWRLFSDGAAITHVQPYWPADSLEEQFNLPENWRELLAEHHRRPDDFADLERMAILAAQAQGGGEWSVDFARTTDGRWILTDMAVGKDSYRWEPETA